MHAPQEALRRLYENHAHELKRFAGRLGGAQDAEDIMQESYLRLLQSRTAEFADNPKAYLFRTAINLSVDSARKKRARAAISDDLMDVLAPSAVSRSSGAALDSAVELRQLCALLNELPVRCRRTVHLHWFEGLSRENVAARLGIALRTVERHLATARDHLRRRASA